MNSKDKDRLATRQLVEGLDGIYVRDYKFDKEGKFTAEQVEQLRKYFETSEWSPLVRDRDRKTGESSDVMVKLVNGKSGGLFILDVEPKEISIVLILGLCPMEDLGKLLGAAVPGALAQRCRKRRRRRRLRRRAHQRETPKGELEPQGDLGSQNDQVAQSAPPAPPTPPAPAVAQAPQVDAQGTQGPQDSQGGKQNQRTPLPKCKGKSPCFP